MKRGAAVLTPTDEETDVRKRQATGLEVNKLINFCFLYCMFWGWRMGLFMLALFVSLLYNCQNGNQEGL
jgi:hypothetical protein